MIQQVDVIVNGDLEEETAPTGETSAPPAPKTAKQLVAKRNQERVLQLSNTPTNESSSHALMAQDGLGGYD
ncbi:hypothetical protein Tco_1218352 [Tanacetum coccineum]